MLVPLFALQTASSTGNEVSSPQILRARAAAARQNGPNGYADYLEAAAVSMPNLDWKREQRLREAEIALAAKGKTPNAKLLDEYRAYLRPFTPAFESIRRGNTLPVRHPTGRFTFASLYPEGADFKNLTRALVRQAHLRFAANDLKGGTEALHTALVFSRKTAVGGHLHALVGRSNEQHALSAAALYLPRLAPTELNRLDSWAKAALAGGSTFAPASKVELATYRASFDDYVAHPDDWLEVGPGMMTDAETVRAAFASLTPTQRDTLYNFLLARLERPTAALLKRLNESESRWLQPLEIATGDNFPAPDFEYPKGLLPAVLQYVRLYQMLTPTKDMDAYSNDLAKLAAGQRVQQRLLRLHLALHRYRKAHARFPTSLAPLSTSNLPLVDPATGRRYAYAVTSGTFRLAAPSPLGEITLTGKIPLGPKRPTNAP